MLTLVIPVYKNEGSIADLLDSLEKLCQDLNGEFEAVFVVDGSPDYSYELLLNSLPAKTFRSQLVLLSKNFGSFQAIRVGLKVGKGQRFAVMAADLQEPPRLILEMDQVLRREPFDVVVGVRDGRRDPIISRMLSNIFWSLYRRYVVAEIPQGGVDVFGCNREFRDNLLKLDESHSSLIAQVFWLGFRRKNIGYIRQAREYGKSGWTFSKKIRYLADSVFAFTDLPIRLLTRIGATGVIVAFLLGSVALVARMLGLIVVPGYAMTILAISFFGAFNLLGLGIVGSYAWRSYENSKGRPLAIILKHEFFGVLE